MLLPAAFISSRWSLVNTWTLLLCWVCLFSSRTTEVRSFAPPLTRQFTKHERSCLLPLEAAGMGMGMKKPPKGKKKKAKKTAASSPPFDVSASLLRLEKRYDELALASATALAEAHEDESSTFSSNGEDNVVTTEYIVAARSSKMIAVSDWVPVAQLCIARPQQAAETSEGVSDGCVHAAVSQYCREIFHAATLGAPVFNSVARNEIQYSVETMDSFQKHVYEAVVEERKVGDKTSDETMSKAQARKVLRLEGDEQDASTIKRAYRSLSFKLHPDRFVDSNMSKDEALAASEEYHRVKLAYETLISGVRGSASKSTLSWYESLGGRARTDFHGPVNLLSLESAKQLMGLSNMESAVVGIDPEMVQTFVARNQAASVQ